MNLWVHNMLYNHRLISISINVHSASTQSSSEIMKANK